MRRRGILIATLAVGVASGAGLWWSQPGTLPVAATQSRSLLLLDRNGSLLRDIPSAARRMSTLHLDQIPPLLQQAFIQAEDQRFYLHHGVDARATLRALWQNLRHGHIVSGASTLTMQSARLAFGLDRGWWDKIRQAVIALRLERHHSKGDILEYYLNNLPFGGMVYGVGQACQVYFATDCTRLSAAQAATLAVLARAPSALTQQSTALRTRRDTLLTRMHQAGVLNDASTQLAQAEPLTLDHFQPVFDAPHFTEFVQTQFPELKGKVRTTLDATLQRDVQALVHYHVERIKAKHVNAAAVLVVNNADGAVLAYVGSPDYNDVPDHGQVDYTQTLRQPGSSVKPFTYALALKSGYTLASIIPDMPRVFTTAAGPYRPRNYSGRFTGPRRLREALANSLNIPALYTAMELGPEQVLKFYRHMGLTSLQQSSEHYGPGITLGNGEVSLWEMVQGYLALARQGESITLRTLSDAPIHAERLLDARLAYMLSDVMRDPLAREDEFGRYNPLTFDYSVAAKTGTSTDFRDNWVVGFSGELTVGVWVGHDKSQALHQVSGITGAGPLFHDVMERAMQGRTGAWPPALAGLVRKTICPLSGKLRGPHCETAVSELFLKGHAPTALCDYHRAAKVAHCKGRTRTLNYVTLPSEYSEWQHSSNLPSLRQVVEQECDNQAVILSGDVSVGASFRRLEILEPATGSLFAIDPTIPRERQQLAIHIMRPLNLATISWQLNDQSLKLQQLKPDVWLWPMQKGRYTLQAHATLRDGTHLKTEAIAFVVK